MGDRLIQWTSARRAYERGGRRRVHQALLTATALLACGIASASDWVLGNVSIVEDYTAWDPNMGILVTLTNQTYYVPTSPIVTVCTQRYRIVVGLDGVTTDIAHNMFATLLTARASGQKVRLFVDPNASYGGGYCAAVIVSIGDV